MKKLELMLTDCFKHIGGSKLSESWRKLPGLVTVFAALCMAGFLSPQAHAQTTLTIKPFQIRMEVPAGLAGTYYINPCSMRAPTNVATSYYLDADGTNYWVIPTITVGVSGAPSGCTATLVDSGLANPIGPITFTKTTSLNITNGTATSSNLIVKLVFDGTQVSGVSTLLISATGTGINDTFYLPVEVSRIWNGSANAALNGAGSFTDPTKWLGGAPGPTDNVVFTDVGAQTNTFLTTATSTNILTNCVISSSTVISSLRFAQTNGLGAPTTNYHTLYLNPGVNLAVAGNDGFKMLRDYTCWNSLMRVAIYGTNGTFIQTNENSGFSILSDYKQQSVLDMSHLGNLYLDVNRLYLDDFSGYPNNINLIFTNGYTGTSAGSGQPSAFYATWSMAGTNYVKATYVDPYNYTNVQSRNYALTLGRDAFSGGSSGKDCELYMGYSNVFNLDSVCVAGTACSGADFNFQNAGSTAKFRNADGVSRMSVFTTADAGGVSFIAGSKTKCGGNGTGVDFTKGTVDMLVDRLYLSLDGTNNYGSGNGYSQTSGFFQGAGTIDANTVILGYQSQGNATNGATCYATYYLTNSGVLKVNNTLTLGYTTAAVQSAGGASYGVLNIAAGGTVMANNIAVGGPAKTSLGNNIALTTGGSLIVSNGIADATPYGALGTLSLGGNSSLTLFVNGAATNATLVYVTNLTAASTGNKLVIGGFKNLSNPTNYPAYVPLISFVTSVGAGVFDAGVTMPPGLGLHGTLVTSSSNTVDLQIISRTGNHLVWRGPAGTANWDYTTKNWQDQVTGLMTNYENPDFVAFDNAPGYATNVVIAGGSVPLTPSVVNMTNSTLYYTFQDGGNSIIGSPTFNKYGAATVEVDANTTFSVNLNQGALVGTSAGSVGGVTVAAGAVLNYAGTIGGGLNCAGTATSSGTISGALTVLSGGIVTNSGTLANPFTVQTNALLVNTASGQMRNVGVGSSGSPQVAAGGTFINNGSIGVNSGGDVLYVNGTFEDLGGGSDTMTMQSITVGPGGTFIPGGDGIGTTTIHNDGSTTYDGAGLLTLGSTTVFKVDPSIPANTVLTAAHISFGGSSAAQTQGGSTLLITNVSATPFSAGQTFHLFDNIYNTAAIPYSTGSSTNTFPAISPATPGPGLAWDLTHLWVPNGANQSGIIGVVSAASGIMLTNSFAFDATGTNLVATFAWDQAYSGYRLETLVTPNTVGLSATNWTGIAGSWTNLSMTLTNAAPNGTNSISTNCVFYRLVFP